LAGDTIVKTAVARRTQFFKDNMKALCDRLVDDWDDINAMFFPTLVLKKLIKVSTTGADYHKKGKQVLILTFKAQPPRTKTRIGAKAFGVNVYNRPTSRLVRLIYKPSDVELDWRVVGDTGRLTGPTLKHLLKANGGKLSDEPSLFAAINAKDPKFQATTTPFRLPVYSILPRNPGSELALAGQALPIDTSYGYIEFLTHEPAAELDGNLPTNLKLNAKRPGDWDWIAQDPSKPEGKFDLQNFYYTHGWYLLLGLIMNFGDQHSENIIVHERRPCLIDLEIIFKHRAQEIEATMLEYHYAKNLKDKNFLLCRKSNGTLVTTIGKKAAAQVKRGFADALAFFKANQAVFTDWLDTDEMKKVVCRYTPRATQMFTNRMWEAHSPVLLTKKLPDPNTPDDWKRGPYTSWQNDDLLNWYSNGGKGYGGRPVFAICTPKHDFTCYHNCDAPAYYRRLGELDLRDARGEPVTVNDPGGRDNVKIRMKLLSTGEGKTAVAILAGSDPKEGIEVTARDTGDAGMRLSITLEVNPGGDGDQPMTAAVASEDKDEDGVQQTYRTLTVTFPREGGAPKTPTVKAVVDFI
ncbi:MAG: DUF4135 domain-containing protein, partial [Planctomycetota bacterium]|nr:DUF4135 domain-containing protein [Planctomycetota bacterium]